METEILKRRIRELARTEAYHLGPAVKYNDISRHLPSGIRPRFIAEQAELAGFPVWSSCPDEALTS